MHTYGGYFPQTVPEVAEEPNNQNAYAGAEGILGLFGFAAFWSLTFYAIDAWHNYQKELAARRAEKLESFEEPVVMEDGPRRGGILHYKSQADDSAGKE